MRPLEEIEKAFLGLKNDPAFQEEYKKLLVEYSGRPTALTLADQLTKQLGGAKIYLKREDLNHTGAHKINNALGQAALLCENGQNKAHRRNRRRPARCHCGDRRRKVRHVMHCFYG